MFLSTTVVSRRGISAVALAAALSLGALVQTSFAADEPDIKSAAAPVAAGVPASIQPAGSAVGMVCSYPAPCIVNRSSSGWEMDFGGPALHFEAAAED